ncbi:uncharacterized protein LOC114575940 [Exaiptasia diaphana]|uniref:Uncharacterized protein n=1 Tax=Exaiptasia diaphana TaxID=2652724 RepID=A0A913YQX7_EXADI|nr:uncharacterized protein LOC114575940 [Exaiptasia diaphana]
MPFTAICCCQWHEKWWGNKPDHTRQEELRLVSRDESKFLELELDTKSKSRKVCVYCRSRIETELQGKKSKTLDTTEPEIDYDNYYNRESEVDCEVHVPAATVETPFSPSPHHCIPVAICEDKGTQCPSLPSAP